MEFELPAAFDDFGALPVALDFYLDSYDGDPRILLPLRGRSGWLSVAEARMSTPVSDRTSLIVAAVKMVAPG